MPFARCGDIQIHYELEGDPHLPVLVFSNSLGTNLGMWEGQLPRFRRHFQILRYDSRGHGQSDAPKGPYTIESLGRDVLRLLDELGIATVSFCGLSKGGTIGMWLGSQVPDRLDRLVLCNTAAHYAPPSLWDERIRIAEQEGMEAVASGVLERWFTANFVQTRPEEVARVREMLLRTPAQGFAASCAALKEVDLREMLRFIPVPTLLVAGDEDPATPVSTMQTIQSAIPNSEFQVLSARHLSNIEAAESFNGAVRDFLLS